MPATFELGGQQIDLEIGPIVASEGYATLPVAAVDADPKPGVEGVRLYVAWADPFVVGGLGLSAVRLIDPEAGTVSVLAHGGDGPAVLSRGQLVAGAEPVVGCVVFAEPAGKTTDVLLPYVGYVADVPVIPAKEAGELLAEAECELSDLSRSDPADLELPVASLESYVEELGGDVRTRTEDDAVTVAVSADVLFATDSAELGGQADTALRAAGAQLAGYSEGTLNVVGHTDDVASDAYNMDLSVRRAQAATDRLGQLVELGSFTVRVEGRGESEPAVDGHSEAARAQNRRVELEFTPVAEEEDPGETTVVASAGSMPATDGPVAPGPDGVTITDRDGQTFTVSVDEVRRIGPNLVGELTVESVNGDGSKGIYGLFSSSAWDARGEFSPRLQFAATNVTLLVGSTRYYPLDYVRNERGSRDPLVDRYLTFDIEEGQSQTVTVVWPGVPGDTVTVDVPALFLSMGQRVPKATFRLTDVPVVEP